MSVRLQPPSSGFYPVQSSCNNKLSNQCLSSNGKVSHERLVLHRQSDTIVIVLRFPLGHDTNFIEAFFVTYDVSCNSY